MEVKKKGDLLEGYRILSELGKGAASTIYLAQDPRTKQVWALKHVEKDASKDQRFLDQAEAEFEIARQVAHGGIRRIDRLIKRRRQFISTKELVLVMELVDGVSLDRLPIRSVEQGVAVFHQVAEALAAMHSAGYVHADMKPNNVVVSDTGVAKIIDLGQSCKIGTIKPRIQGTPDYIAPEQVHRRAITPKTDIYNLGATMYWVLTHRHIPTAYAKNTDAFVGSLDDHLIPKPTPILELLPSLNPRLAELIMHCVEVDPARRPETMRFVADRLHLILGILRAESQRRAHGPTENGLSSTGGAM